MVSTRRNNINPTEHLPTKTGWRKHLSTYQANHSLILNSSWGHLYNLVQHPAHPPKCRKNARLVLWRNVSITNNAVRLPGWSHGWLVVLQECEVFVCLLFEVIPWIFDICVCMIFWKPTSCIVRVMLFIARDVVPFLLSKCPYCNIYIMCIIYIRNKIKQTNKQTNKQKTNKKTNKQTNKQNQHVDKWTVRHKSGIMSNSAVCKPLQNWRTELRSTEAEDVNSHLRNWKHLTRATRLL